MRMPKLLDLHLLFSQSENSAQFHIMPSRHFLRYSSSVFSSLKSLSISNACLFDGVFEHVPFLEALTVLATTNHPRVPIALSPPKVEDLLRKLGSGGGRLLHSRIMIEKKLSPDICHTITTHCPNLEMLEVELRGYHDGDSSFKSVSYLNLKSQLIYTNNIICLMDFNNRKNSQRLSHISPASSPFESASSSQHLMNRITHCHGALHKNSVRISSQAKYHR
jgi:hypothetical protein